MPKISDPWLNDSFPDPWDDINVSYDIGDTRTTDIEKSINEFIGEIDSEEDNPTRENIMERLIQLQENSFFETPQNNMYKLIQILDERKYGFPQPGDTFTFIYKAKTPNLLYDLHPVSTIIRIERDRFFGYNHHLGMVRQYSGKDGRILSNFYKIDSDELDIVLSINTKLLLNT